MVVTIEAARRRIVHLALIFGAFVLLATMLAAVTRFGDIETDLEKRSRAALLAEGMLVEVEFDGRDATLRGPVGTEEERLAAIEVVSGVRGVRTVHDDLTVLVEPGSEPGKTGAAPVVDAPPAAAPFRADETGTITLGGHRES